MGSTAHRPRPVQPRARQLRSMGPDNAGKGFCAAFQLPRQEAPLHDRMPYRALSFLGPHQFRS